MAFNIVSISRKCFFPASLCRTAHCFNGAACGVSHGKRENSPSSLKGLYNYLLRAIGKQPNEAQESNKNIVKQSFNQHENGPMKIKEIQERTEDSKWINEKYNKKE